MVDQYDPDQQMILDILAEKKRKREEAATLDQPGNPFANLLLGIGGGFASALANDGQDYAGKALQAKASVEKGAYDRRMKALDAFDDEQKGLTDLAKMRMTEKGLDRRLTASDARQEKTLAAAMARSQGTNDRVNRRNDILEGGLDLRKDSQASHAADVIHKDPTIHQLTSQIQLVDRGRDILNKPGLTNQEFNDVQIELSNAIAGARSSALGKLERTEYETMGQKWAELKQRLTGSPQDAVPSEILARVRGLAEEMSGSMQKHRSEQAQRLARTYAHNHDAQREQDNAIYQYDYAPEQPAQAPGGASGATGSTGAMHADPVKEARRQELLRKATQ